VNDTPAIAPFLDVLRAADLQSACPSTPPWLIEQLWSANAVGIVGGMPKSLKTWLALEMAVAVASGSSCLGQFAVPVAGPVLLYAAEDSQTSLRGRLESLVHQRGLRLADVDLRVIIEQSLRLDRAADQERLEATLTLHRPALLILDPLVRLHAIDENAAGEIAALLGYLRLLQRKTGTAIGLVHHARKNISPNAGAGYSLRGSSDLYAWVDSFLYLRRHHGQVLLSAEHRSGPSFGPFALELVDAQSGPYLKPTSPANAPEPDRRNPLLEQILTLLRQSSEPRTAENLRSTLQVRNQRVVEALRQLCAEGQVVRLPQGYALEPSLPFPLS
jgi:hypothetical protein